eukprot:Nk52_evm19s2462 gene=Nk52_evmTU19s2462
MRGIQVMVKSLLVHVWVAYLLLVLAVSLGGLGKEEGRQHVYKGLVEATTDAERNCKACRELSNTFMKRMNETESKNSLGGDTSWEEERNFRYATSEMRLIEVLDHICGKKNFQCDMIFEQYEPDMEDWFFNHQGEVDFFEHLCINKARMCCPSGSYGPECKSCPQGHRNESCGGKDRGDCIGDGVRGLVEDNRMKGTGNTGKCYCSNGYTGRSCDRCAKTHYRVKKKAPGQDLAALAAAGEKPKYEFFCRKCDSACAMNCTGPGPENCVACLGGYFMEKLTGDDEKEDEVKKSNSNNKKKPHQKCSKCDESCVTCDGPADTNCVACKKGYYAMNLREQERVRREENAPSLLSRIGDSLKSIGGEGEDEKKSADDTKEEEGDLVPLVEIPERQCVKCSCHGRANSCRDDSGSCIDCRNSVGDHCETCKEGYRVEKKKKKEEGDAKGEDEEEEKGDCVDIDECKEGVEGGSVACPGTKDGSQVCTNIPGKYTCRCAEGYEVAAPPRVGCQKSAAKVQEEKEKEEQVVKMSEEDEKEVTGKDEL